LHTDISLPTKKKPNKQKKKKKKKIKQSKRQNKNKQANKQTKKKQQKNKNITIKKKQKKQPNERYNSHEYHGSMFNLSSPDEPHSSSMLTGKISTIRQYNCEKLTIGV
jgi:hypothetical protein